VTQLTWLGHASVLIEMDGVRLLTDPVLRERVAHLRRHVPPAAPPDRLDAVLLSHLHRDHLDLPSMRALGGTGVLVVPRGAAKSVQRLKRETVELAAGDSVRVGAVTVHAVTAVHDGRRSPASAPADTVGYVVEGSSRVYFAGDTELFATMADLVPLDAALMPIWGWGPSLGPGHMDPDQAAKAVALIRPALAIPIHWGTYLPITLGQRRGDLLVDPPHRFAARCAELAPDTRVAVLSPGETMILLP
jgi:L-ascorbate metabolism protein UlaG (beta-lactamase superfamily)